MFAGHLVGKEMPHRQWCPAPPFEIGAPHFTLAPRLLHTSNTVFLKCGPPLWFLAPLLLNPGDGP